MEVDLPIKLGMKESTLQRCLNCAETQDISTECKFKGRVKLVCNNGCDKTDNR